MKKYSAFISLILVWAAAACLEPTTTIEHPCELADHCIYNTAEGTSDCAQGYTWENPEDLNNYNCVLDEMCAPSSCEVQGYNCGDVPDGCEAILNCGSCPAGQTCGAGGPNICGEGSCTPTTCAAQGANCGSISDGCGGILDCGTCPEDQTCGGGGVDNVCGSPTTEPPTGLDNAHLLQSLLSTRGNRDTGITCAITANNNIACWGYNNKNISRAQNESGTYHGVAGQCNLNTLGQVRCANSSSYTTSMIDVSTGNLKQFSAAYYRMAGITTDGALVVWDIYEDNAPEDTDPIPEGNNFVSTTINTFAACGLKDDGNLVCWKHRSASQDAYNLTSPPTSEPYKQAALGDKHGCALTTSGSVKCWGVDNGETGSEYNQVSNAPTSGTYLAIAASELNSCALADNGQVKCWGYDYNNLEVVMTVDNPSQATLAMASEELCVRTEAGQVTCAISAIPELMQNTHLDLSLCLDSICTISSEGKAICHGKLADNDYYQLVDWNNINTNGPYTQIATWSPYYSISNNPSLLCTVDQNGRLRCWSGGGQPSQTVALLSDVSSASNVVFSRVGVGINFGCGLNATGGIMCLGDNSHSTDSPAGTGYTSLDVGQVYSTAIDANGQMHCWGVGASCAPSTMTFKKVSVDMSGYHTSLNTWAIDTNDNLHQWGFEDNLSPTGTYKEIGAGGDVACAITTTGTLECWGMDNDPPAGSNYEKVKADTGKACALTTAGKITCWGDVFIPAL